MGEEVILLVSDIPLISNNIFISQLIDEGKKKKQQTAVLPNFFLTNVYKVMYFSYLYET